jgi:hypothetical protein
MSIIPNIKFPIPKSAQGTSFSHAEDILNHLRGEHSGQWLISRSSLFHGGIHISCATTPWCALRGNDVDEPGTGIKGRGEQALICMADGEVVAYRICKDYLKAPWFTGPLSYSGSFVLIKHKVMPGETESSQLTFYTLYMHLAPWTAYQSADTSRFIINEKSGLRAYLDESHEICAGVLPKGTRVIWDGKTTRSFNKRDYAQITLEDDVTGMDWDASAGSQLWVLADHGSSNLKPVEVALPAWWKPLEQPMPVLDAMKFDQVVNLNTPLAIKAGDAIGHMGYFEDAYDQGKESDYRVHIECFTDDERLKTFLTNPEHVKTGEQFLKIVPGLTRTARAPKPPAPEEPEKEGKKSKKAKKKSTPQLWVFTAIDGKTTSTWCLPVSKLPAACPDESGKKYYRIDQESCWIAESDMTPVHQYDLEARGFNAIESSAGDVILHMNGQDKPSDFVSQLLNILKEAAKQYLGVDAALIPDSYQRILNWINGYDGKQWYDTNIIRNAIHYTMLNPQLNMLIVKHPSEWFYKSGSAIWNKPLKDMTDFDPQHATLNKSLIDSLSWMAEVKGVNGSNGVWHMHPFAFLEAFKENNKLIWIKLVSEKFGNAIAADFKQKVIDVGTELSIDPNYIMACIALETGTKFNTSTKNPKSSATGLIQFMANTAKDLGTSTSKLAAMTHVEQMDYVKKYFVTQANNFNYPTSEWSLGDVYLSIFTPSAMLLKDDDVVYSKGQNAYEVNLFHDRNNDGKITKKEIIMNIEDFYKKGFAYEG